MSKEEKGVSTSQQYTPKDVPAMLEKVNNQIKSLKGGMPKDSDTKGKELYSYGEISKINSVPTLIRANASISLREDQYKLSCKELELDILKYPFRVSGLSPNKWREAIKSRAKEVSNKEALKKLEDVKKILEENLSKEAKFSNDMANIVKILGE